jgi:hypothetical protein
MKLSGRRRGMGSAYPVDNKGRRFYEHLCMHTNVTE